MARKSRTHRADDPATANFQAALDYVQNYPLLAPLEHWAHITRPHPGGPGDVCPAPGWAVVRPDGWITVHPIRLGTPDEWIYVLAHCLLHLGFGHFRTGRGGPAWSAACDCAVASFLEQVKLGRPPAGFALPDQYARRQEGELFQEFSLRSIPESLNGISMAGPRLSDMIGEGEPRAVTHRKRWPALFADGLRAAAAAAVDVAGGRRSSMVDATDSVSPIRSAYQWVIADFPLIGAVAAAFTLIEDRSVCQREQVSIAAVDATVREIYANPTAGLTEEEWRFVMAHEFLHPALRHETRLQWRDPYLWNVACDFIINAWLVEMKIGRMPAGVLYDPALAAESAEGVYDRIATDARRFRKLATLRGTGLGDILGDRPPHWWSAGEGMDLDEFYRRCLSQGYQCHLENGRGLLPSGLVQEIRTLEHRPIPWDVALARWFAERFPLLEPVRTYARLSRRHAATPDIPRPARVLPERERESRTFGVVLDTSGSMNRRMLGRALGAIASYARSREVPLVRIVYCDAAPYDQGYVRPEDLSGRVSVRGGGGTVLQPAIDLLDRAPDFPREAPVLIITDGCSDHLVVRRDHAYLLPAGRQLPFSERGPIFRIDD
ncbi:MAG TPA: VWA-like domain-containing protein [Symbiobacteriaceae bacterium]|jgi:predicted metal-dependent peptidase